MVPWDVDKEVYISNIELLLNMVARDTTHPFIVYVRYWGVMDVY